MNDDEATPQLVQHLDTFKPVRIAATDCLGLALDAKGQLRQWGMFKVIHVFVLIVSCFTKFTSTSS